MANEGDLSSANEEFHLQVSLQHALNKGGVKLKPKGSCYYCFRGLSPDQIFCDEDCAEDHAYEQKRRQING